MNKTISILRIAVLISLGLFAFLFLFVEEQDESTVGFILHFLLDKSLAILAILAMVVLYKRWLKEDEWLQAYDKFSDVEDAPNPVYLGNDEDED